MSIRKRSENHATGHPATPQHSWQGDGHDRPKVSLASLAHPARRTSHLKDNPGLPLAQQAEMAHQLYETLQARTPSAWVSLKRGLGRHKTRSQARLVGLSLVSPNVSRPHLFPHSLRISLFQHSLNCSTLRTRSCGKLEPSSHKLLSTCQQSQGLILLSAMRKEAHLLHSFEASFKDKRHAGGV